MNIFSFIKSRVPIWDVINEYATLKKAGMYWKARCPFHHEKTASFTVSPHKDIFYCFGCHTTGDVISFIAKVENCSQLEAAQFLAERYQIELPSTVTLEKTEKEQEQKKQYFALCKLVAQWCHEMLSKTPSVIRYLHKRGFTQESIDCFTVGYFPGGQRSIKACIQYVKKHNILLKDLIDAHIFSESKTVVYSPFEDRLIFPITDHLGRFCGFGGRVFKAHDTRPKYYNSRENDYFAKGALLFGLDHAKKNIQETGIAFLVEGYTDCIAMVQHGFANTIATLGTACTAHHLKQLSRYAQYLYVLYDSDTAGQQAILRLTELCWQANMELKVIALPIGQDPASFLASAQDLQPCIANAKDIFLFFIESLGKDFTTKSLNEKVNLTRTLLQIIHTIDDPLKQDILLQKASKTFDIPFDSLKKELGRTAHRSDTTQPRESNKVPENSVNIQNHELPRLEKRIFCAIINNIQLFNKRNEKYLIDYMPTPLDGILKKLCTLKSTDETVAFTQFFDALTENEKHYVSKLLLEEEEPIPSALFEELVIQLHKKQWKIIVHDIKVKLAQAKRENNENKVQQIMQDFLELKQKIVPNAQKQANRTEEGNK